MTQREFNKTINACRTPKRKGRQPRLDLVKIKALPEEVRKSLALFIVRNRGPLLVELAACVNRSWLASCGYLYTSRNSAGYAFVHTAEHEIK